MSQLIIGKMEALGTKARSFEPLLTGLVIALFAIDIFAAEKFTATFGETAYTLLHLTALWTWLFAAMGYLFFPKDDEQLQNSQRQLGKMIAKSDTAKQFAMVLSLGMMIMLFLKTVMIAAISAG